MWNPLLHTIRVDLFSIYAEHSNIKLKAVLVHVDDENVEWGVEPRTSSFVIWFDNEGAAKKTI